MGFTYPALVQQGLIMLCGPRRPCPLISAGHASAGPRIQKRAAQLRLGWLPKGAEAHCRLLQRDCQCSRIQRPAGLWLQLTPATQCQRWRRDPRIPETPSGGRTGGKQPRWTKH